MPSCINLVQEPDHDPPLPCFYPIAPSYHPLPWFKLTIQNSWGGRGTKKSKKTKTNPKFLIRTAGIEPAQRKDFQNSNVIITEKKDKKASAFQVKDLPYPYTSIEQYEARFKTPLGSEWNSRGVHQKETMPRVVKKVRYSQLSLFLVLGAALIHSLVQSSNLSEDYSRSPSLYLYCRFLG